MRHIISLRLFSWAMWQVAPAQEPRKVVGSHVEGSVLRLDNKAPVSGRLVKIGSKTVWTDSFGRFVFEDVPPVV